ncbi:MAG: sigma-70 family RNA polymerase sigma factor [Cyclobacteriaceae bacterium]
MQIDPKFNQLIDENKLLIQKVCRVYSDNQDDFLDYYQEVCIQLWRSMQSFRGDSAQSTWVYRVAINTCIGQLRKVKRKIDTTPLEGKPLNIPGEADNPTKERLDLLYQSIRKLKETDRALILLYLEDKSYKEITDIMGITMSNVGVRINRIKAQLKGMING